MSDTLKAREVQRAAGVALAIAVAGYVCVSVVCFRWPSIALSFVTLVAVGPAPGLRPVVLALLGPPAMLLLGSENVSIYGWMTAILALPVLLVFVGLRGGREKPAVLGSCVAILFWASCGGVAVLLAMD